MYISINQKEKKLRRKIKVTDVCAKVLEGSTLIFAC